ncbi:hypothetical protein O6H91_11G066800 [Diphasiastrum complanatum]|uniref:Uncharacterized protein n=1 Tax=Diphasiastrum complanatum TaxID=34168 RepID=A0ACC2C9Z2_DIPCM|nr:hypothetical protein O6H91_11G066800 [Diphasiastrum complanatum]
MESVIGFSVSDIDEYSLEGQLIIWNTIFAFASSMALKVAILLDIPDILARAGPEATLSSEQISAELPSKEPKADYLKRILRFLAVKKIFSETAVENSFGVKEWRYGLTNASKWLVKENNDLCLAPMAVMQLDKVTQAPWHHVNECVLEGGDAFERANGTGIWNYASVEHVEGDMFQSVPSADAIMMKVQLLLIVFWISLLKTFMMDYARLG